MYGLVGPEGDFMKVLKTIISSLVSLLILLFASSCFSNKPPVVVLPLVIDTATPLPTAVINVPYTGTVTAKGGVQPYMWTVASGTLPPGLSLSTSGVISGTPTTLGTTTFKVQVTDSQSPTAAINVATKSITVNAPLAVQTSSLTAGSLNVPYTAVLAATGGVPPYAWTVTSGALPAGLTLSTTGLISGTPTTQGVASFTVQVSDSQTPASTASSPLSLTINGPTSRLNGNYVFSFTGYSGGASVVQAGSFTADGVGNLTNGLMDSNSASGVQAKLPFTGTYSIDTSNTGPMTLVIPALGTFSYQLAVPASGTIRFIQNGGVGGQGSGVISQVAGTTKITISSLAAFWAFGASGADVSTNRYAAAGTFQSDTTGTWTSGFQDTNDNGTSATNVPFTGSFVAIDPVTGRGTATLTVTGGATTNYSFYPVSTNQIVMMGIDPVSTAAPLALFSLFTRPLNTYTNANLNTTTVAWAQGIDNSSGTAVPDALLAFVTFDGKGGITASSDQNDGGTLSTHTYTGTYNVESDGRTTITGIGTGSVVFYLSANIGFVVEGDTLVTAGTIVPQSGTPYTNASISGSYQGATIQAVLPTVTVEADSATPDGSGNYPLFFDTSGPGGPQQGLTLTATYSVDATGRAPLTVSGQTVGIAYVVNSSKIVVLTTDANPKVNSLEK